MKLSEYMEKTGKSAATVAKESGVSASTISRHLAGKHQLSSPNALRIFNATDGSCSFVDLIACAESAAEEATA